MSYFGRFQRAIGAVSPWFLRQKNIATVLEGVGLILDGAADGMLQGMRLGYPLRCPASQLPVIARDRSIKLYPTEPVASQREGLRRWWWLHKVKASHQGEMRNVQRYFISTGLPTIRIVHQEGTGSVATWHTLDTSVITNPNAVFKYGRYSKATASPSNFNFDGQASKWARWWVFIDMSTTGYTAPITYGSGHTYGDGSLYGVGGVRPLSAQAQADLVSMILDWKAGDSWCGGIILVWPGAVAFPDHTTVPTQDADGRWSLPNGANTWASTVDPTTGKATRPANFQWIYDNPA